MKTCQCMVGHQRHFRTEPATPCATTPRSRCPLCSQMNVPLDQVVFSFPAAAGNKASLPTTQRTTCSGVLFCISTSKHGHGSLSRSAFQSQTLRRVSSCSCHLQVFSSSHNNVERLGACTQAAWRDRSGLCQNWFQDPSTANALSGCLARLLVAVASGMLGTQGADSKEQQRSLQTRSPLEGVVLAWH